MLIGNIQNISLDKISYSRFPLNSNIISFKGKDDAFISSPEVIKGSISQEELDDILKTINENKVNESGYSSKIFKLGDRIIKVPKDKSFQDIQEKQLAYG